MDSWLALDYRGGPFELFGTAHLLTLLAMAALTGWLLHAGRGTGADARRLLRRGLALVLLVNETAWHAWNLAYGVWQPQTMLPVHVCSVMVWLTVAVLWFEVRTLHGPVYFLGIAGAVQALVTPDAGIYGFPHFRFFQTMIAHGALVAAGLWVVIVDRYRPTVRDGVRVLAALNAYALAVYFLNGWLGSNYLYVNGKPETPSIIDAMPDWPWYVPILELLALVFFALLLVPFVRRTTAGAAAPGASPPAR